MSDEIKNNGASISVEEDDLEAKDASSQVSEHPDPLALPEPVQPEKHASVASENTDNDAAYASDPKVDWMRKEQKQIALRIEETIVIKTLKKTDHS